MFIKHFIIIAPPEPTLIRPYNAIDFCYSVVSNNYFVATDDRLSYLYMEGLWESKIYDTFHCRFALRHQFFLMLFILSQGCLHKVTYITQLS